jgi:hypothetical protein
MSHLIERIRVSVEKVLSDKCSFATGILLFMRHCARTQFAILLKFSAFLTLSVRIKHNPESYKKYFILLIASTAYFEFIF